MLKDGQKHTVNSKYHVGELVPEYLKDRWTLILGDSKKERPQLLERIGKISIFLHDSLHTYDHMMFEYETAWPHITKRGFLLSHDIFWNDAFMEFCKKGENKSPLLYYSLGILRKEREDHKP